MCIGEKTTREKAERVSCRVGRYHPTFRCFHHEHYLGYTATCITWPGAIQVIHLFFAFCSPRWHVFVKTHVSAPPNSTVTNACHSAQPRTQHTTARTGARRSLLIVVTGLKLTMASVSEHSPQYVKFVVPCSLGEMMKPSSFSQGHRKHVQNISLIVFHYLMPSPAPPPHCFPLPTRCAYQHCIGGEKFVV